MSKLSDSDKSMIVYFWQEKGDLTRWCDWEKNQSMIEAEYPELTKALKDLEIAKKLVELVVKSIDDNLDY